MVAHFASCNASRIKYIEATYYTGWVDPVALARVSIAKSWRVAIIFFVRTIHLLLQNNIINRGRRLTSYSKSYELLVGPLKSTTGWPCLRSHEVALYIQFKRSTIIIHLARREHKKTYMLLILCITRKRLIVGLLITGCSQFAVIDSTGAQAITIPATG